ncbi:MAG: hypothetical protein FWC41_00725 [Firmicutes bacterium]|nr:hypothetical protein [Bacillota bacterium]
MPFSVSLHADNILSSTVKRRYGGVTSTPLLTIDVVNNSNLGNANIYADNGVELSISLNDCANANYIVLSFGNPINTVIAGQITELIYNNDKNTTIMYVVDVFSTAQMTNAVRSGFMGSMQGLCERTNLTYPGESVINQLGEPVAGSNVEEVHNDLTNDFNDLINEFLGIKQINNDLLLDGYKLVLWISNFAAWAIDLAGGTINQWAIGSNIPKTSKNIITTLTAGMILEGNKYSATRFWYGGVSNGVPLVFSTEAEVLEFVDAMMSNIGIREIIPPDGLENDGVIRRFVRVDKNNFHADVMTQAEASDMLNIEMEQTRVITFNDVLKVMILPNDICTNHQFPTKVESIQVDTGYGLNNFNPLSDERDFILPDSTIVHDYSKSKVMQYPYWYFKMKTRMGNEVVILPQLHFVRFSYIQTTMQIKGFMRFVGGDEPCLQISINQYKDLGDPRIASSGVEWLTIYTFPSIPWSSSESSEQQLANLSTRMLRRANVTSAIMGKSQQGYLQYGFNGGIPNSANQGFLQASRTATGNFLSGLNPINNIKGHSAFKTQLQNDINQETVSNNASSIIATPPHVISGESAINELFSPPVTIYRCGFTDGELFAFCRFLDRRGQATDAILNPITNSGSIFGGQASVSSVGNKTFYKFYDFDVNGTMPVNYKNEIINLFVGGVYLVG